MNSSIRAFIDKVFLFFKDVSPYLAFNRKSSDMCYFYGKENVQNLIEITISYYFNDKDKIIRPKIKFSWTYEPPEDCNCMINTSILHKNKLSFVLPLLRLSSRDITYESSTLEVIKIKDNNTFKRSIIVEKRDVLYFSSSFKGNLVPKKASTPHMDVTLRFCPTGLSQANTKSKKLIHFIPKSFEPISISKLFFTNPDPEPGDNGFPLNNSKHQDLKILSYFLLKPQLETQDTVVNSILLKEIFSEILTKINNCDFGENESIFVPSDDSKIPLGSEIRDYIIKDKFISTNLHFPDKKESFQIAIVLATFEEFFD